MTNERLLGRWLKKSDTLTIKLESKLGDAGNPQYLHWNRINSFLIRNKTLIPVIPTNYLAMDRKIVRKIKKASEKEAYRKVDD
ncbi:MAG: hypothetical protein H7Y07_15045 [Pyrinomonadaceae bacterium]|nr:hypothetical protein [Sphingobacteriaceae bacterium]